jgi:hypothetical protein
MKRGSGRSLSPYGPNGRDWPSIKEDEVERVLWTVASIAMFAGSALAQQPGAYCEAGSDAIVRFAVTRRNPATQPDDSLVYNNCSPGDTIIIPGTYLSLIARICDFSRSVVATSGGNVLCVVGPPRPIRTNRR